MACETICTFFYVFLRFFQNPKKHDFLRFFELLHTFSRTVVATALGDTFVESTVILRNVHLSPSLGYLEIIA